LQAETTFPGSAFFSPEKRAGRNYAAKLMIEKKFRPQISDILGKKL
jgi:hypothetical protein